MIRPFKAYIIIFILITIMPISTNHVDGATPEKNISIKITPSDSYFSEGNKPIFSILVNNNSNETRDFRVTGILQPDGQTTSFKGDMITNETTDVPSDGRFIIKQPYKIHWQGNWVLNVNVTGTDPNTGNTMSDVESYWLFAHSSTEQFIKQQAQNSVNSTAAAVNSSAAAMASLDWTRNSLIVTSIIAGSTSIVAWLGLRASSSERRVRLRPWVGKDDEPIDHHGFFDSKGELTHHDLNSIRDEKRSADGVAYRCTVWFRNFGSLPADNVQIKETEHAGSEAPNSALLENISFESRAVIMPNQRISYDFSIEMKKLIEASKTNRVFQIFQIRYEYGNRIAFYELTIELVERKFVHVSSRTWETRRSWFFRRRNS